VKIKQSVTLHMITLSFLVSPQIHF